MKQEEPSPSLPLSPRPLIPYTPPPMKSERRHELQQNQLAKGIIKIPTFLERHGNKLFIAVIVVSLAVIVINWRSRSNRESLQRAGEALSAAHAALNDLRAVNPYAAPLQTPIQRTQH